MEEIAKNHENDSSQNISRFTNLFIKKMTNNLSLFNYNVLIANLHELYNYLNKEIKNVIYIIVSLVFYIIDIFYPKKKN